MESAIIKYLREKLGEDGKIELSRSQIGVDNEVYFCTCQSSGKSVIKCYTKKSVEEVKKIYSFHKHLEKSSIPVPEVISPPTVVGEKPILVTRYVEGEHLATLPPDSLQEIAYVMADIHSLEAPAEVSLSKKNNFSFDKLIHLCGDFRGTPAIKEIYQRIDKSVFASLPRGYIHGDFSHSNILWKGGSIIALLDEDHCREDFILEEISRSMIFFAFPDGIFSSDVISIFLQAYTEKRKITGSEKKCLYDFLRLNLIRMILETYYYVYVIHEVPQEIFTKSRFNLSPENLFGRLVQVADIGGLDI